MNVKASGAVNNTAVDIASSDPARQQK